MNPNDFFLLLPTCGPRLHQVAREPRTKKTAKPRKDRSTTPNPRTRHPPEDDGADEEPSATARLNAIINEEARGRRCEWRTEYSDYYETTAQQYPRKASKQRWVQGAHTPAGPGVRREPRFFDLAQTVDKYTPTERRMMEESGVRHPKPWLGTSPGKWKAPAVGPEVEARPQSSRPAASAPPRGPQPEFASPFFRHLDVLEQSKVQHAQDWRPAVGRWDGGVAGAADREEEPTRRKTYTISRN